MAPKSLSPPFPLPSSPRVLLCMRAAPLCAATSVRYPVAPASILANKTVTVTLDGYDAVRKH